MQPLQFDDDTDINADTNADTNANANASERGTTFSHPCRCGGEFLICEQEMEEGVELVGCEGCSEIVRVLYQEVSDEE